MRIGIYLSYGSEMSVDLLIALARRRGCRLYLPAIADYRRSHMQFVQFDVATPLLANRFGILEPDRRQAHRIAPLQLDLVFVPLVAVDAHGWRLGSGAGFYDRRLHRLRPGRHWRRPKLIGIGYDFQRVPQLDRQPWDVPLDAVATDQGFYRLGAGDIA
jgi:5-formyltetrahydrofolate cyclo-ligase